MMQITQTMVERIKEAVPSITAESPHIALKDMGGYFVTSVENEIPANAKQYVKLGIDGATYVVFMVVQDEA